jgi:hypothetical protein
VARTGFGGKNRRRMTASRRAFAPGWALVGKGGVETPPYKNAIGDARECAPTGRVCRDRRAGCRIVDCRHSATVSSSTKREGLEGCASRRWGVMPFRGQGLDRALPAPRFGENRTVKARGTIAASGSASHRVFLSQLKSTTSPKAQYKSCRAKVLALHLIHRERKADRARGFMPESKLRPAEVRSAAVVVLHEGPTPISTDFRD